MAHSSERIKNLNATKIVVPGDSICDLLIFLVGGHEASPLISGHVVFTIPKRSQTRRIARYFGGPLVSHESFEFLKGEVPDLQILGSSWMTVHGWKLLSWHVMTFQLNGPKQCSLPPQKEGIHHPNLGNNSSSEPSIIYSDAFFCAGVEQKLPIFRWSFVTHFCIRQKRWDDHPQYKELMDPGTYVIYRKTTIVCWFKGETTWPCEKRESWQPWCFCEMDPEKWFYGFVHSSAWLAWPVWAPKTDFPDLPGCQFQVINEKHLGCLEYIGDYTTQLYRDYNKPL